MSVASPRPRRGAHPRPVRAAVIAACALLTSSTASLAGCAAPPPAPVPLPSFPTSAAPEPVALVQQEGIPPCEVLLPIGELEAVLGLPLGEVVVREVRDVAAPSVGRLHRTTCTLAGVDTAGPVRGVVFELTVGRYTSPAAARSQRERNAAARAGGPGRPVALGAAQGIELAPDRGPELLLDHGDLTVELRLPAGGPAHSAGAEVLTDLALRALARLPVRGRGHPG